VGKTAVSPEQFSNFGDLLKYLRRREELTQRELAIQVGYSDTQISRIEQNQRVPDDATLKALFVPALHLEQEAEWVARFLDLARQVRLGKLPEAEIIEKSDNPNNLPALLTTFIGREKERVDIKQLISTHRLVTLTGSGGVGKTRLSLEVGRQVFEEYVNGVWFIDLAPLSDPELLAQNIASVFGIVTKSATIPHTQLLINFLRAKSLFLILDNCEHLLDACASLADTLLKNCSQLKILATSRQPLGILGEVQYRLPSLGLPDVEQSLETLRDYESVRLFEQRAQLVEPDFKLTAENAASVAQICSRLDGIPLAIELAAARVNIFSTAQLAERLVDCFGLLTGGSRTALPRQQTIRASIDWSWNLISDDERTLLRRLTVFAGGWTLEAAEIVCGTVNILPEQVPELLNQLLTKSLVMANRHSGRERRFHLHATIKQYAYEKLVEVGERNHSRDQHLKYYLGLSAQAAPAMLGPQQREWHTRLTDERDNIRMALNHAVRTNMEAGLYLSAALVGYWRYFDLREGLRWTTQFVENPESKKFIDARVKALLAQGILLWNMQQFETVQSIAEECLAIARDRGDPQGEYDALMLLGGVAQFLVGMEEKAELNRQALVIAKSLGDVWRQAITLSSLGWDQRDPALGRQYWEEGIALLRQTGDWRNLAQTLGILGFTALSNGDLRSAQKALDEAYEINQQINNNEMEFVLTGKAILALLSGEYKQARAFLRANLESLEHVGNRMGVLWARARIAYVALREGNVEEAHQILIDVIENFHRDNNRSGLAFALDKMASLYVVIGKPELASPLIGWSDATRGEIGDPRPRIEQEDVERDIQTIKGSKGTSAFKIAYNTGRKMALDEMVLSVLGIKFDSLWEKE